MNSPSTQVVTSDTTSFWAKFKELLSLIRFSHTLFALPFALMAAFLAWRTVPFELQDLIGLVVCMIFARSAAMAFNRIADRKIDAENPRTAGRHLPAGTISLRIVVAFTIVCSLGFILSTLLFWPNRWPLFLSVPVLLFLMSYSYSKRFTSLCHYWLSAALMLSPIAAWIAITGTLAWPPILLAAVIFFWVGGFDIIYATQDAEFDHEKSLFSIPSRFGVPNALKIAFASHVLTVVCLLALWAVAGLGTIFLIGVILVSGLLIYEHWIISPSNMSRVNVAFFHINALISVGLLFVTIADILIVETLGPISTPFNYPLQQEAIEENPQPQTNFSSATNFESRT
ncbi:4-hydroxybenzoate octaprenyltransferase [Thalassoglobus neptunius]|uniref:4-hydroxybenzoate polyprenyltransferase n=1 Tax=Thalassoglobus neptunius TaxID=1938619 RepID=A0A5C5WNF7_9PLAN|nr:UbiA-like polyprenyltransferase [Thalassoglobus neptunius]TWT51619.1 4-hydroxybenzoate octaprenyltransferase [Thalassoglobus neptunius]